MQASQHSLEATNMHPPPTRHTQKPTPNKHIHQDPTHAHRQQELEAANQDLHKEVVPVLSTRLLCHALEHVEQVEQPAGEAQGTKGGAKGVTQGGAQTALRVGAGRGKVPLML